MTLTYTFLDRKYYEHDYEYEADDDECLEIILTAISDSYKIPFDKVASLYYDDLLLLDDITDDLIDEIKEHFKDRAAEAYEDYEAYMSDPYSYYGVSRSDF